MKALLIGGTGTISSAISQKLCNEGCELYLLNRGNHLERLPQGARVIIADANNEQQTKSALAGYDFDVVADFIAFTPEQVKRDFRLFSGKTRQYIFISSASAYQKPVQNYVITEKTPLCNPFWEYSHNKALCEEYLFEQYCENGFPVTIVRPSHTYCERSVPVGLHGKQGSYSVLKRMIQGKEIIVHGDGESFWTMTDSRDFADGFIGLMGNAGAIGQAVQITSDESLCWNGIYRTIAAALGVDYKPFYVASQTLARLGSQYDFTGGLLGDKAYSVKFDNTKLKRLVPSFRTRITFEQGVRRTIAYVMSHPELQITDEPFDRWCDGVISKISAVEGI